MDEVKILAYSEITADYNFNWNTFWLSTTVILGLFITVGFIGGISSGGWSRYIVSVFIVWLVMPLLLGTLFGISECELTKYETRYKVTIYYDMLMNDFLEKYEIVSQDGKIYTVRERWWMF